MKTKCSFIVVHYLIEGVVRVIILKARDLVKADLTLMGKGKSDPFVRVKGNRKKEKQVNGFDDFLFSISSR